MSTKVLLRSALPLAVLLLLFVLLLLPATVATATDSLNDHAAVSDPGSGTSLLEIGVSAVKDTVVSGASWAIDIFDKFFSPTAVSTTTEAPQTPDAEIITESIADLVSTITKLPGDSTTLHFEIDRSGDDTVTTLTAPVSAVPEEVTPSEDNSNEQVEPLDTAKGDVQNGNDQKASPGKRGHPGQWIIPVTLIVTITKINGYWL